MSAIDATKPVSGNGATTASVRANFSAAASEIDANTAAAAAALAAANAHAARVDNPHTTTAAQVGLGSVNNTSDAGKPVSTAQQTALDLKAPLASPTFTGTVTLPAAQVVNGVTLSTVAGISAFLRGDGTYAAASGGGGGTVTSVSVFAANGVTGTVATATTTPAITLALGAITPTSVVASGAVTGSNLSGTNTGDNAANTTYSGLVSNATHTGDATGATALTLATVNANVGSFTNATVTVNAKGLITAAAAGSAGVGDMVLANTQTNTGAKTFLNATLLLRNVANTISSLFTNAATVARTWTLPDKDGTVAMTSDIVVTGLTGPITSTGNATAVAAQTGTGTTFVMQASPTLTTPNLGTPSAGVLTNATGTAAGLTAGTVTTNANLTGEVTSTGNAATLTNSAVIGKVITGYVSGAGVVAPTDSILAAVQKLNGNDAGKVTKAGDTLTGALNSATTVTVASATTTDIGAAASNEIIVSGIATITGLGTIAAGARRWAHFSGALILTHNATSLILPTGANITTVAGDTAEFVSLGAGNWRCSSYDRASGSALVGGGGSGDFKADGTVAMTGSLALATGSAATPSMMCAALPSNKTGFYFLVANFRTIIISNGGAVQGLDPSQNESYVSFGAPNLFLRSGGFLAWSNDTGNPYQVKDTGLVRNAAGVVEFNNGTLNTFADWKARNGILTGLIATAAAAPTLASAATIAPVTRIAFVSGVVAINTITAPSPISAGGGQITLIPTGLFSTTTAGNIALATTAVVNRALILSYDVTAGKWYPSY